MTIQVPAIKLNNVQSAPVSALPIIPVGNGVFQFVSEDGTKIFTTEDQSNIFIKESQ